MQKSKLWTTEEKHNKTFIHSTQHQLLEHQRHEEFDYSNCWISMFYETHIHGLLGS